ncbi:MAG: hypothetical protein K9L66_05960 [Spirochaetaceae bacterium]|nr:hypothetical protein [Spirochaetaceae bacterium]MCF7951144.1 hypothetical protein [Spirochaetaceae bacterium]
MVLTRRSLAFPILLLLVLFFSATIEVGARGQQEDRLEDARSLIEENRYNDAILLLTQVMKENPRKFDEAEKLLQEVREARRTYNQTYQELIEILDVQEGETLNEQEAYDIIQRLEELDADPNKAAVEAFAQARRSIIFTVNNQRFQGIMQTAGELLEQERYVAAVEEYLSGFTLHQELFDEEEHGSVIENQVDSRRNDIRRLSDQFFNVYTLFSEAQDNFSASEGASVTGHEQLLNIQQQVLELWDGIIENANALEQIRLSILGADTTDIPLLSTLRVLTLGRAESEQPVGIAGAIEQPLVESMQGTTQVLQNRMTDSFEAAVEQFKAGEVGDQEDELFNSPLQLVEMVTPFIELWEQMHALRRELEIPRKIGPAPRDTQSDRLYVQAVEYAGRNYNQLIELTAELNQLETGGLLAEQLEEIRLARGQLLELLNRFQSAREEIQANLTDFEAYGQEGVNVEGSLEVIETLQNNYVAEIARLRLVEGNFVKRIAELRYEPAQQLLTQAEEAVGEAEDFVEGVERVIYEESGAIEVRYPNRSIELVNSAQEDASAARSTIESVLAQLNGEKPYIQEQEPIISLQQLGREFLNRIDALTRRRTQVLTRAEELNRRADIALSEGDIRLQQTRAEVENERFELAREKLEQAGNAYSESLSFREDPEVRAIIDEQIPRLADQILFEQNQAIVREVRNLIDRGRELFFQEKFIEAEQVLTRAQSRWRQTHPEDDPEVSLWLDRVKRALEATSGVTIEEADPLYADMMQVLNLAKENYQRGKRLYDRGQRSAAMELFAAAEEKIEYIKEPFPNNRASGVLYLRILEYTQPEDFESIFSSRFREARNNLESSPEEAYRELQVLREIKPDYPGLEDAIYQAEIATGIRQPPPDPQKLARARDLYRQAQEIVEQDIRAQFPVAVTYLNEAIKLDPDYREAIVLKDRIQTGQGGQVSVVLSSVDQQKLRRAENLFIDGRYFEASVIVDQLWQNPENRSNPKLAELRRRIESQL